MDGLFAGSVPRVTPTPQEGEGQVSTEEINTDNPFAGSKEEGQVDSLPHVAIQAFVKDWNLDSLTEATEYAEVKTRAIRDAQRMKGFNPDEFITINWEDRYAPKTGGYHAVVCWSEYLIEKKGSDV